MIAVAFAALVAWMLFLERRVQEMDRNETKEEVKNADAQTELKTKSLSDTDLNAALAKDIGPESSAADKKRL